MFGHTFKHTFKSLLRKKASLFWALVFPIILGLLFKTALGNIDKADKFVKLPVSVNSSNIDDEFFLQFIDKMEEDEIFEVTRTDSTDLIENKEVVAHIENVDEIITNSSGIKETIVENIITTYNQNKATVMRIMQENPQTDISKLLKIDNFIEDKSRQNMDLVNTFFYTLLGMQIMYGYIWGLEVMYQYEANLSTEAKRISMAPINKKTSVLASLLAAWIINIIISLIIIAIFKYLYQVNFGDKIPQLILLTVLTALTGVSFGSLIAVSNKRDKNFKMNLGISLTMLCCFLAGMMAAQIKVIIQKNAPIINKLNPVALITDGIYSLYYYNSIDRFMSNVVILSIITLIFIVATFVLMRGKKYDSL